MMEKPPIRGSQKRYVKVGAKGDAPKGSSIQAFSSCPSGVFWGLAGETPSCCGSLGTWAGRATAGQGAWGAIAAIGGQVKQPRPLDKLYRKRLERVWMSRSLLIDLGQPLYYYHQLPLSDFDSSHLLFVDTTL